MVAVIFFVKSTIISQGDQGKVCDVMHETREATAHYVLTQCIIVTIIYIL